MVWHQIKQGGLTEGENKYDRPPCTCQCRLGALRTEKIVCLLYKTSNLNEEANRTEPSPSVSIPWSKHCLEQMFWRHKRRCDVENVAIIRYFDSNIRIFNKIKE